MRKTVFAALLLALLLSACGGELVPPAPEVPDPPQTEAPPPEPEEPPEPAEEELDEEALEAFLNGMSLEEKVGQLFFVRVPAENAAEDIMTYHLGGYILFGRDTQDKTANEIIQAIASYQRATDIPLLIGVDEEGGTVVRVSSNSKLRSQRFSSPRKLWQKGGDDALSAVAEETAEKSILLKALGFNVNLNPVADVSENPSDFIYDRTTGGNAAEAEAYVRMVVRRQSRCGLGSVLKHFPGYGNNKDTHTGISVDSRPMETFLERDFLPFQAGMASGGGDLPMPAVLVSHNIVSCMDADLPASLSLEVHRILREDLGFNGVVMTDDLAMSAVKEYAKDGAAAGMALQAGNDLVVASDYRAQIPRVIQAVKNGELEEAVIDEACSRVLRWKVQLGLLAPSETGTLESTLPPKGLEKPDPEDLTREWV